jgi:enamine deaminase RidA (YjgF/YER057c/UK114 family)
MAIAPPSTHPHEREPDRGHNDGSLSAEGDLIGEGDFEAQARRTFENLRAVLEQAGMTFDSIVKLGVYVTDIAQLPVYGLRPLSRRQEGIG